jgi:hypothetical protein
VPDRRGDPSAHHQPKKNLLIHARLIPSKVTKAIKAPRWCVTTGLSLTRWFIAYPKKSPAEAGLR